jgi:hypothetical protein
MDRAMAVMTNIFFQTSWLRCPFQFSKEMKGIYFDFWEPVIILKIIFSFILTSGENCIHKKLYLGKH